ncbi:MAG: hypothetical protein EBR02_02420 [Alphaproteobacteria bacterium]|nr:hypothetical protein [Alphaproteobacteria bacterium]
MILLLFAVVAVLVAGVVLMGIGGKTNEKYANKLMIARVSLQGLAILLLVLMFAGRK